MKSKTITFSEHQSAASKARHAKKTPEERSAYAKMMVQKREEKRAVRAATIKKVFGPDAVAEFTKAVMEAP